MSQIRHASCHCGTVKLEVTLPNGLDKLIRCNCSLCKRKGAVMMGMPLERLRVVEGAEKLTLYQWNTRVAKHYFCSVCGIYTHHQRRSDPTQYGINVACLEGVDPLALGDVTVLDGASLSIATDAG
jgi:hypothetical protein